jgi:hypothetical protein
MTSLKDRSERCDTEKTTAATMDKCTGDNSGSLDAWCVWSRAAREDRQAANTDMHAARTSTLSLQDITLRNR